MTSKVVGEGTFGCVLKPSLKCNTNKTIDYKDRVSKLMFDYDARNELKEYAYLSKIKGLEDYALIAPIYCKPKIDKIFDTSVKKCKNEKVRTLLKKNKSELSLLLLHDGGINLYHYIQTIFPEQSLNDKKIFLTSLINLFDGLIFFQRHKIIHRDIKLENIVYNIDNGKSKYIDFGLMTTKDKYVYNCKNNKESLGISWNYFPPENSCSNKNNFNDLHNPKCVDIKSYFKTHDNFLEHMTKSFDIYCLSLGLMYIIPYLKRCNIKLGFIIELTTLLSSYCIKNVNLRKTDIKYLKDEYIKILKKHDYYLNKLPSPSKLVVKLMEELKKEEIKKSVQENKCPPNKPILNPNSGRCVIECKSGFIRNKDFRCVSGIVKKEKINKTKKVEKSDSARKKDCESQGKVYNSKTKRCNKKTEKIKKTSADKIKDCESQGKVYNSKTKRCNKKK